MPACQHKLDAELTQAHCNGMFFLQTVFRRFAFSSWSQNIPSTLSHWASWHPFCVSFYLKRCLFKISSTHLSPPWNRHCFFFHAHHSSSHCIFFSFLTAVYNWCSEGQGHKHLHLLAWWRAGFCQAASSNVPAGPASRQTPRFVQEDHRLHTYGSTSGPGIRWTNIPCVVHGHRCVWIHVVLCAIIYLCNKIWRCLLNHRSY